MMSCLLNQQIDYAKMKNGFKSIGIFLGLFLCLAAAYGQQAAVPIVTDDLQVDVKSVSWDSKTDTLTVDLFLISYKVNPREFKLNTFATQVIDATGKSYLYSSMQMGRVLVRLSDRQNYMHYLLTENTPVPMTIKIAGWGKAKATKMVLVFEDSAEEGRYIEKEVNF